MKNRWLAFGFWNNKEVDRLFCWAIKIEVHPPRNPSLPVIHSALNLTRVDSTGESVSSLMESRFHYSLLYKDIYYAREIPWVEQASNPSFIQQASAPSVWVTEALSRVLFDRKPYLQHTTLGLVILFLRRRLLPLTLRLDTWPLLLRKEHILYLQEKRESIRLRLHLKQKKQWIALLHNQRLARTSRKLQIGVYQIRLQEQIWAPKHDYD